MSLLATNIHYKPTKRVKTARGKPTYFQEVVDVECKGEKPCWYGPVNY